MIIHELEQKSPEWFAIRKGKMTASNAGAIGNNGKGLDTYIAELMSEYYSSGEKDYYTNKDLERGNELEEVARTIYELEKGVEVKTVGFIEHNEFVGCSPDGLVGEEGGWECKCPNDKTYFKILLNGVSEVDTGYIWQIQMCLFITGRKWWDLTMYNPNFLQTTFHHRFYPDIEKFKKLEIGFMLGEEKIKQIKRRLDETNTIKT